MDWEVVTSISEAIGAIAVVASLLFLGFQMRQNTRALNAATAREVMRDMSAHLRELSESPSMANIWFDGLTDPTSLSREDRRRFAVYATNMCRLLESVVIEESAGHLRPEQWFGVRGTFEWQASQPGFQAWWIGEHGFPGARRLFNTDLRDFVDSAMRESSI
jgi:hypothetical protein